MDLNVVYAKLTKYMRPQTHPVAVRMLKPGEPLQDKTKVPGKNFDEDISVCHAISLARKYGWTMSVGPRQTCWVAALGLGFAPLKPDVADGTRQAELGIWGLSKEADETFVNSFAKLEYGTYDRVVTATLERAQFEPHVILVYGNPAQIWSLVSGYVLMGQQFSMDATLSVGAGCTTSIAKTMLTDQPQFGLVGIGERYNNAQDHECLLSIPASKIERVIMGLEFVNKAGIVRYPFPSHMQYDSVHPEGYREVLDHLMS